MKYTRANMKSIIEADHDKESPGQIIIPVGSAQQGILYEDFADVASMLVSGTTGSGKTSFIRMLILEIMMKYTPEEVRFVIYDSRSVDYSIFDNNPYLLMPIITETIDTAAATDYVIQESKRRLENYSTLKQNPHIIIIMDDFHEVSSWNNDATDKLIQLFRISRKAKIHSWIITSTPLDKVIPQELKAIQLLRVSFRTTTKSISRDVINHDGAETLRSPGEMIFMFHSDQVRCDAVHIEDKYISEICSEMRKQYKFEDMTCNLNFSHKRETYDESLYDQSETIQGDRRDELFIEAARYIIDKNKASVGMIQRLFKIGFNRASRIMDQLYDAGIVGEEEGTKPRKVLMTMEMLEEYLKHI